ncbi:MAG TPA: UTP--glucose-1-phosphate uridylyltransferase GalU [Burkholderiales bacterium]|nr:UTP--glucose-1-phosphate uridylyltransferase GalU [Burkholderiales bacterium]
MERTIRKAVFPVAGLGTRFLPATKASPKEMLPVVDKPLIQYAVEEAVAAGMTEMIFVTGRGKRAIEDHFDTAYELETELQKRGHPELLKAVRKILPPRISCTYVRQPQPLGLGHAILCAQHVVGEEPFAVVLADDLLDAAPPVLAQMADLFERRACPVVAVHRIRREQARRYGIVALRRGERPPCAITGIVEKPSPRSAPSTFSVVGRYLLTPRIFHHLRRLRPGSGGELQLTDAIAALLAEQEVLALEFEGARYDCGSKLGYLQANLHYALRHPEVGTQFRRYLRSLALSRAPGGRHTL